MMDDPSRNTVTAGALGATAPLPLVLSIATPVGAAGSGLVGGAGVRSIWLSICSGVNCWPASCAVASREGCVVGRVAGPDGAANRGTSADRAASAASETIQIFRIRFLTTPSGSWVHRPQEKNSTTEARKHGGAFDGSRHLTFVRILKKPDAPNKMTCRSKLPLWLPLRIIRIGLQNGA